MYSEVIVLDNRHRQCLWLFKLGHNVMFNTVSNLTEALLSDFESYL